MVYIEEMVRAKRVNPSVVKIRTSTVYDANRRSQAQAAGVRTAELNFALITGTSREYYTVFFDYKEMHPKGLNSWTILES